MGYKKWILPNVDKAASARLSAELNILPAVAEVLAARGKTEPEQAQAFLNSEGSLSDPFVLQDMDKAADRINQAIDGDERIAVYGDYDADGVTATAILVLYLESAGADVTYYIPSREDEGYGMNKEAVQRLHAQGVGLIVTVDNGITALEEIAYAASLGIDVVVTDHHKPKETLPAACAVVDPHRKDCKSPFKDYCGAGIALLLITALSGGDSEEMLDFCGDLAAVGTIADVVPLVGENRLLVTEGLTRLRDTQNIGLAALIECCSLTDKPLYAETVAYTLVPRINAAGRLGLADVALKLLLSDDYEEAMALAAEISKNNAQRQELEAVILRDIHKELTLHPEKAEARVIILAKEGWHHGVTGIVAAKLVERYAKPCFLLSIEGETARGSGRGVAGYSLFDALLACDNLLLRYGGHTAAAGLTLKTEHIAAFAERIEAYSRAQYALMPVHSICVDRVCEPEAVTLEELKNLSVFEPFGCGNETIRYCFMGLTVAEIAPLGGGKHLRLRLNKGKKGITCVYFGMTEQSFPYKAGDVVDILAACDVNEYQGRESVSVKIRDIRPGGFNQEEFFRSRELYERFQRREQIISTDINVITPSREEIGVVYRLLKEKESYAWGVPQLAAASLANYGKTMVALLALKELGLIATDTNIDSNEYIISIVKGAPKANLADSAVLQRLRQLQQ